MKGQDFPGLALSLGAEEEGEEKRKQGSVGSKGCLECRHRGKRKVWGLSRGHEEGLFLPQLSPGPLLLLLAPSSTIQKRSAIKALEKGAALRTNYLLLLPPSSPSLW